MPIIFFTERKFEHHRQGGRRPLTLLERLLGRHHPGMHHGPEHTQREAARDEILIALAAELRSAREKAAAPPKMKSTVGTNEPHTSPELQRAALMQELINAQTHGHAHGEQLGDMVGERRERQRTHAKTPDSMHGELKKVVEDDTNAFNYGAKFGAEQAMQQSLSVGKKLNRNLLLRAGIGNEEIQKYEAIFANPAELRKVRQNGWHTMKALAGLDRNSKIGWNPMKWATFTKSFLLGSAAVPFHVVAEKMTGRFPGAFDKTVLGQKRNLRDTVRSLEKAIAQAEHSRKLGAQLAVEADKAAHAFKAGGEPEAEKHFWRRMSAIDQVNAEIRGLLGEGKFAEAQALLHKLVAQQR